MTSVSKSDTLPVTSKRINNFTTVNTLDQSEEELVRQILEDFQAQLWKIQEPRSAILISIYIPLFICSVVGNIFVLVIVLPFRRMRNVTHCFIVNLAISDLLC